MEKNFTIRNISNDDLQKVTDWAKLEGFAPGIDDISIYKNTDKQGVWVGCVNDIHLLHVFKSFILSKSNVRLSADGYCR